VISSTTVEWSAIEPRDDADRELPPARVSTVG
jgi:hypothetical protein